MSNQTQNIEGEWVPAIPLPYKIISLFGRRSLKCNACGREFTHEEHYMGHYAYAHILKLEHKRHW